MTKLTKKAKQVLEMLEDVKQPTTGVEAIKLLTEDSKSDEARARKLYRMRYGKSLGY